MSLSKEKMLRLLDEIDSLSDTNFSHPSSSNLKRVSKEAVKCIRDTINSGELDEDKIGEVLSHTYLGGLGNMCQHCGKPFTDPIHSDFKFTGL